MNNKSGLASFLLYVRKLNNIGRWSNEFLHQRASVAEHLFSVVQIAQMLGIIEENNNNTIDWKSLYRKAVNHDVPEALMGDVISTTKNATVETKKALDEVEKTLVEVHLLSKLKSPYKEEYEILLFDGKDETTEGKILRYADNIDALIECIHEIKLSNNDPFILKYYAILGIIEQSTLISVQLFLKDILPVLIEGSTLKAYCGNTL